MGIDIVQKFVCSSDQCKKKFYSLNQFKKSKEYFGDILNFIEFNYIIIAFVKRFEAILQILYNK